MNAATRSKQGNVECGVVRSGSNAPELRSDDEAARRAPRRARKLDTLKWSAQIAWVADGGWFDQWGDSAAGLGHIFAAAWVGEGAGGVS